MSTHINAASKNDIAPSILLPGDPLRAKFIAENFLNNPKCYNEIRGMLGYTGTYKGVPVSVHLLIQIIFTLLMYRDHIHRAPVLNFYPNSANHQKI